ncbi:hypothetical protein [Chitinophaga sedimenti]|uniref:hypothetical protein n=1 Tax=Chitinophaga sedimenti TaxID=2033606 RepID=UPI003FD8C9CD
MKEYGDRMVMQITVVVNFEPERELLGLGECVKVLSPRQLAERLSKRLQSAAKQYKS